MSILYQAIDLCQNYNGFPALRLPDFTLHTGEAVTIAGPNGSGKSTLLRLLAFLEKPASGILNYYGRKEGGAVTLLLQEPYLLCETVFDNVVLGLKLRGQKHGLDEAYGKAMRLAGFTDPAAFASRWPRQLSGGEKQRISLASRLALEPQTLLLDEPTAYVDQVSAKAITDCLKNFSDRGAAIVCATHDISLQTALHARNLVLQPAS